jgi:large subunit ribosomal protein L25
MSKQVKVTARPRAESGRNAVKKLRARGGIPANVYGAKHAPANLEVSKREIGVLLSHAVGENILVDLEINADGKTSNRLALIQEVQRHPFRDEVLHVDFHAVSMTEEIETEVVIEPIGEPVGVKAGGLLQHNLRSLEIKCLPQDLPELLEVDVSALNINDSLHVRDIKLPKGVTAIPDGELTVFLVSEPTVVEEPVAEETAAGPEVINEKKSEDAEPPAEGKK